MILQRKTVCAGKGICKVELVKEGTDCIVKVDGDVYKRTTNELFAVQEFNEV
jgi:hypothetical protein|nr:MAG TPA: hypothetical protein [Caudoviricetes sp.]